MSYKLKDVLHQTATHWVLKVKTGYEVYKQDVTHSTRVAQIGWPATEYGLQRAIAECNKRSQE